MVDAIVMCIYRPRDHPAGHGFFRSGLFVLHLIFVLCPSGAQDLIFQKRTHKDYILIIPALLDSTWTSYRVRILRSKQTKPVV